jgi:hypothetical protein
VGGIGIQTAGRQQKVERALKWMTEGICNGCGRMGGGVEMEGKCQRKDQYKCAGRVQVRINKKKKGKERRKEKEKKRGGKKYILD